MDSNSNWKFERHYYPAVIELDNVIERSGNVPRKPSPLPNGYPQESLSERLTRNPHTDSYPPNTTLRDIRNSFADVCGIPHTKPTIPEKGYGLKSYIPWTWGPPDVKLNVMRIGPRSSFPLVQHDRSDLDLLVVIVADDVIGRIEDLIWQEEYPRHGEEEMTRRVIHNPKYAVPNAIRRNALLSIRNALAIPHSIPERTIHDHQKFGIADWMVTDSSGKPFAFPHGMSFNNLVIDHSAKETGKPM